jgi:hypothetical protein
MGRIHRRFVEFAVGVRTRCWRCVVAGHRWEIVAQDALGTEESCSRCDLTFDSQSGYRWKGKRVRRR